MDDLKLTWRVKVDIRGFEAIILLYGTEQEVMSYMEHEFGYRPAYVALSDEEINDLRILLNKALLNMDRK